MWDDLIQHLSNYPTAVLTAIDTGGYPFSIRLVPEVDSTRQVLRTELPGYVNAQAGPADLLCHWHDDMCWNQTNFVAYGTLDHDTDGWIFRPTRLIEGAGAGNPMLSQMRFRKSAKRYLERHDMDWPAVPYKRIKAIYKKAQAEYN